MTRVSLPYYEYSMGRGGGSLFLEAHLSRHLLPEEICLLASRRPVWLDERPSGVVATPWGSPGEVLRFYVERATILLTEPPPPRERVWRWMLRRLGQELNRLIAGGLVGPPVQPEVSEDARRARLARRLCKDVLGDVISGRLQPVHQGLRWRIVEVEASAGATRVARPGGGSDRILEWLASRNPGLRSSLEALAAEGRA
ncbi:hypothetical protein APE_2360.1 [Aeropyrum pernix K1]|uniref:Uncharacterized protein n=1 Tax=Aeropyrum pernix (strain ATCC 700893 / DSM 11879 / JCM 9820 / NBRC 100138 / K1) TaxID=272557 RepID=Q9Y9C7_AERPE|nr:hypothetical protein [Aeropyrum pernix]BAA81373.2 hypothetical protein APE_2360.1 [Aeropyrum pernix K1]